MDFAWLRIHHQIDRDLITTSKADFKLPTDLTRVAGLIHKEKKEKVTTHEVDRLIDGYP